MSAKNLHSDKQSLEASFDSNTFPEELKSREQWVVADTSGGGKQPFIPWTPGARGSWSDQDAQGSFEQAKRAAEDNEEHKLGLVLTEEDPFVLIDFDDARDPKTGKIDSTVTDYIERANSYTDLSTSGTGLHIILQGELPDGIKAVDSPIGENAASVEVYDSNRFVVMTGEHLSSSPMHCVKQQEVISELASESRTLNENTPDGITETPDRSREEISQVGITTDPDVVWDAVRHTAPSDIRLKSEVTEERSDGTKSRDPSWEHSDSGTRIGEFEDGFVYREGMVGIDCLQMVALEEGIIHNPRDYPDGEDFWNAVDALRSRGAAIPEYQHVQGTQEERSFQLASNITSVGLTDLSLADLREEAQEETVWPSTEELRARLNARIRTQIKEADDTVIEAPTAAGKTHIVATTAWMDNPELTDGAPILHLSKTRKARNDAYNMSQQAGVDAVCLRAGEEMCPVAKGEYDEDNGYGNRSLDYLVSEGQSISEWVRTQTRDKGIPYGRVHSDLNQRHKRTTGESLPCCCGGGCDSTSQWDRVDLNKPIEKQHDLPGVIHATHQFAHVAGLVEETNVVFDEQPEFGLDLEDRLYDSVESFLREVDAPVKTWEEFIRLCTSEDGRTRRRELRKATETEPDSEWYLNDPDAHTYAPAIVRALADIDDASNQRYVGETDYQPFYRGGENSDTGTERVTVVLNDRYEFEEIKTLPPLSDARCVVGLDAYPDPDRWQLNTLPSMTTTQVLNDEERRNWRRFERGLFVVQVGEADRPLTTGKYFNKKKAEALMNELTDQFSRLRTAVTSKSVKQDVVKLLPESDQPQSVLHYGEEFSRNDFADERVGLIVGCIDPGDDTVLNWLALADAEAEPERSEENCKECGGSGCYECLETGKGRARGREFVGPDADTAKRLLESVRQTHVAQAAGRYARSPTNADKPTVVFTWTGVTPDSLVDFEIPDVRSLTQRQQEIIEYVEQNGPVKAREVADALEPCKEYVRQVLKELAETGHVSITAADDDGRTTHFYEVNRHVDGFLHLGDREVEISGSDSS